MPEQARNAELQEVIRNRLGHSGHQSLRQIDVIVDNDRVILSGEVATFYLKQMAQETVRQACPNRQVHNDLDVLS